MFRWVSGNALILGFSKVPLGKIHHKNNHVRNIMGLHHIRDPMYISWHQTDQDISNHHDGLNVIIRMHQYYVKGEYKSTLQKKDNALFETWK